jgi:pilus assembly protein Flp/PilA
MRHLGKSLLDFLREEDGPTAVEYAVMLALIIVIALIAIQTLGLKTSSEFSAPEIDSALKSSSGT